MVWRSSEAKVWEEKQGEFIPITEIEHSHKKEKTPHCNGKKIQVYSIL